MIAGYYDNRLYRNTLFFINYCAKKNVYFIKWSYFLSIIKLSLQKFQLRSVTNIFTVSFLNITAIFITCFWSTWQTKRANKKLHMRSARDLNSRTRICRVLNSLDSFDGCWCYGFLLRYSEFFSLIAIKYFSKI